MILKKFIVALAAICAASLSGSAFAQATKPTGIYLGAGFGTALSNVTEKFNISSVSEDKDSDTAYKIYGGYDFGNGFGLELGYYDLGSYSLKGTNLGSPSQDDFSATAIGLSGVLNVPMGNNGWFFSGKLGIAMADGKYDCVQQCTGYPDKSSSSVGAIFGLGFGYNINKNFAVRADWESVGGIKYDWGNTELNTAVNMLSVSGQVRF